MSKIKHSYVDTHRKKRTARTKLLIVIALFVFMFSMSSVYAMATGWLTIQGIAARTEVIQVEFSAVNIVGTLRPGEFTTISAADNNQIINASLLLAMPSDSRTISFSIRNTGNQAVRLLNISTVADTVGTGLVVQWPDDIAGSPNLTNYVLSPGGTATFLTVVGWQAGAYDVDTGLFREFSITFNYQNASLPYTP
ncbi:hypothetical protein FWF48_03350 [Candidatus Saccharibacteria bacterium]|nr:hypothetical protein [Candidatus Saccharibacteria bacterium]